MVESETAPWAEREIHRPAGLARRPQYAGAAARPRCARRQYRRHGRAYQSGRHQSAAAQQGRQIDRDRSPADGGGRHRHLLHDRRRGGGNRGRRNRRRADHLAGRDAADDRAARRPEQAGQGPDGGRGQSRECGRACRRRPEVRQACVGHRRVRRRPRPDRRHQRRWRDRARAADQGGRASAICGDSGLLRPYAAHPGLRRSQGRRHRPDGPRARSAGAAEGGRAFARRGDGRRHRHFRYRSLPAASIPKFSPAPIPSWIANISRST